MRRKPNHYTEHNGMSTSGAAQYVAVFFFFFFLVPCRFKWELISNNRRRQSWYFVETCSLAVYFSKKNPSRMERT